MERVILTVPDISSEEAIQAIRRALGGFEGLHTVESNIEARQVIVEFETATTSVDRLSAAMAQAGFPVATAWTAPHQHGHDGEDSPGQDGVPSRPEDLVFTVRLLRDKVTAVVGYNCACGCKPQARYKKDAVEAGHEHCCCGLAHFAGSDATRQLEEYLAQRRADGLDGDRVYTLGERSVEAPWGGPLAVAFAVPQ